MAATPSLAMTEATRQSFTDLRGLGPLFAQLRTRGTERARAGNRPWFYDP